MHILILGGGTAGWSTAVALAQNKQLQISIVEPMDIPTIGVGESTLPLINKFHQDFNIFDNLDWAKKSSAVMKFTIDFKNFLNDTKQSWSHPFNVNKSIESYNVLENMHLSNAEITDKFFYTQRLKNNEFQQVTKELSQIGAYHLDAKLYAHELKKVALSRGISIYRDRVIEVNQTGSLTQFVKLENGEVLKADLYIDCTGFHNLLFKKLNLEFTSFTDRLYCDRAITIKLPYLNEKQQKVNATLCSALSSGWVWQTPLYDTITIGYVFSSKHTDFDGATKELKEYLNTTYGYSTDDLNFNMVNFRSGMYKESWVGNNIAIGLSSFFIEPIESTGIALFQIQISELSKILVSNPKQIKNYVDFYNRSISNKILSVKDFVEMHYILSDKKDSEFWVDSTSIKMSEKQNNIIKLYINGEYERILTYDIGEIFSNLSWLLLLLGMDTRPSELNHHIHDNSSTETYNS